jgi:hypothetical protein
MSVYVSREVGEAIIARWHHIPAARGWLSAEVEENFPGREPNGLMIPLREAGVWSIDGPPDGRRVWAEGVVGALLEDGVVTLDYGDLEHPAKTNRPRAVHTFPADRGWRGLEGELPVLIQVSRRQDSRRSAGPDLHAMVRHIHREQELRPNLLLNISARQACTGTSRFLKHIAERYGKATHIVLGTHDRGPSWLFCCPQGDAGLEVAERLGAGRYREDGGGHCLRGCLRRSSAGELLEAPRVTLSLRQDLVLPEAADELARALPLPLADLPG